MAEEDKKGYFVFPHVTLSESQARGLLKLKGRVFICLPWFFEPPASLEGLPIEVVRPDPACMPSREFPMILDRYLRWMEENLGFDHASYLASRYHSEEDFSLESLKTMIRDGVGKILPEDPDKSFYRHLILHLYGRSEAATREAGNWLDQLDNMPSPVAVLLEEPDEKISVFKDHDSPISEAYPSGVRPLQILESWISLFSDCVAPGSDLVTLDEWVAEALLAVSGCDLKPETSLEGDLSYLSFPEKLYRPSLSKSHLMNWLSGKRLALL